MPADRIRRLLAFELMLAAFEAASAGSDPIVVIKGGVAMEVRLRLRGRATKDIDATLRRHATLDEIEDVVRDALANPIVDGAVTFDVRGSEPLGQTGAVRFDIRVFWKGGTLARVRLEVSAGEDVTAGGWEEVAPLDVAANFGIPTLAGSVPCLPLRYQIAQKIHAVTDPHDDNDRFRDLIDLLLLDEIDVRDPDHVIREACVAVFRGRARHAWPPVVTVRPGWAAGYRALAQQMSFPVVDVHDAAAAVQLMMRRIDQVAGEPPRDE
ncbi:MAG: nucleotidyl transferase AbiEii/AbiGii toxin family protein [Actinomycetota bacterium]